MQCIYLDLPIYHFYCSQTSSSFLPKSLFHYYRELLSSFDSLVGISTFSLGDLDMLLLCAGRILGGDLLLLRSDLDLGARLTFSFLPFCHHLREQRGAFHFMQLACCPW